MLKAQSKNGYITTYLALIIGILLSLILTTMEGVRMQTIRFQIECVTDMALNSAFAEYNRQLLEQYDLFFIDFSYGKENSSIQKTEEHIRNYMNMNFQPELLTTELLFRDIVDLNADNVTISRASLASDMDGNVLKYQITEYMKEKNGFALAERIIQNATEIEQKREEGNSLGEKREAVHGEIQELLEKKKEESDSPEEEIEIENPADFVNESRSSALLNLILAKPEDVSMKTIQENKYISHREKNVATGLSDIKKQPDTMLDQYLFQTYLFEKCSYFGKELPKAELKYQIEYLLEGNGSDQKNLESVIQKILLIREAVNVAYLFSDSAKQAEADALALTITSGLLMPELQQAVKLSILFAWAYAESVKDLRILTNGEKVAIIKTSADWNTPLSQLVTYQNHLNEYHSSSAGMSYKEYLEAFLLLEENARKNYRLMDIMEMDIRKTKGNENFCMDTCLDSIEANINVISGYGYNYQISRSFEYN